MSTITTPTPTDLDHTPGTRLVFGDGALEHLGNLCAEHGANRVMIISDPGVTRAGHTDRGLTNVLAAGLEATTFASVHENPSTADVDAAVQAANDFKPDLLIGLGGGSAIDTAKGCNFIYTNGGVMADYHHSDKPVEKMLPLIAVPTTHGTGSEAQSYALIADQDTHMKMACGDPKALPVIALLDPSLTLTQPDSVAACTSIDAITHAVESYVCTRRNDISMRYAAESFVLTVNALPKVLDEPSNIKARGDMLLGAAYAGLAIENSMLGAAHSCANPLTAEFGTIHGQAVGLMLPHVIRFNSQDAVAKASYNTLAEYAGMSGVEELAETITKLLGQAGLKTTLADLDIDPTSFRELAPKAAGQWTANFNPREIKADDFEALYNAAYGGQV
ncbi:MAG: iron-containing alcohol dehydrogenase [Phycisphaeraceae bacterium]|nr:iron-containing alcohol dehydrogenase [Phycisphaeraceae bacterium]